MDDFDLDLFGSFFDDTPSSSNEDISLKSNDIDLSLFVQQSTQETNANNDNKSDDGNRSAKLVVKSTKKKKYYVPVNPLPRILKRDIRRAYASMFANVFNSTEYGMINSFFNYICRPTCQITKYMPLSAMANLDSTSSPSNDETLSINENLTCFIHHSYLISVFFPDFAMKILDVKISQVEGMKGSKLIIRSQAASTKLNHAHYDPNNTDKESPTTTSPLLYCIHCADDIPNKVFNRFPNRCSILHTSEIVLCLDEQHQVESLAFTVLNMQWSLPAEDAMC